MARVRVALRKKSAHNIHVAIELTTIESFETRMQNELNDETDHVRFLKYPNMSHSAVEAACYSGAFYGLRQIDALYKNEYGYEVTVNGVCGILDEDPTPCAQAAAIGVAFIANRQDVISASILEDWELIECHLLPDPKHLSTVPAKNMEKGDNS